MNRYVLNSEVTGKHAVRWDGKWQRRCVIQQVPGNRQQRNTQGDDFQNEDRRVLRWRAGMLSEETEALKSCECPEADGLSRRGG